MATDTNSGADDLLDRAESMEPIDSTETAEDVVDATMRTLGERVTDGQAADLAETLPDVAAEPLLAARPDEAEEFSLAAFVDRVMDRTDEVDVDTDDPVEPVELVRGAVAGVREVADETEIERTREQLPTEFDLVFDPGEPTTADEFRETVANELETAGLDDVDPDAATEATLETLAARITGGQAGDLAMYLPRDVRAPLTDTDEGTSPLDWTEFRDRIASRMDVETDDATDVTRAVFAAIRETTAERELENVLTQLPDEYDRTLEADR